MEITVLPEDLKLEASESLQLYDYRNARDIHQTKINLSKNTISFLRSGFKEVIGDDKIVQIDNQSFLIMKSGNCLMTEKTPNSHQVYQSILLFFTDEDIINFLEKHELYSAREVEKKSFYIFDYDQFIKQFVDSLESILMLPPSAQNKILRAKFEEIMLYLTYQKGTVFLNSIVRHIDDKIGRLTNIVENNRFKKLSLEELAFLCSMSVSTFKREFSKQYHSTPMKWFNEQRLDHIAILLSTQNKRPIDLFEAAGYETFSNFVQAFKKRFGVTPKQYQNKI